MDWLKKNFDKILLIASAIIVLGFAAIIVSNVQNFALSFDQRNSTTPPDNTIPPAPVEQIQEAFQTLQKPASWQLHEGSLLVSRTYILKDGVLIDPLESNIPLHPPIPNKWIMEHNLDPSDNNLLTSDPDGDSFTTMEEWMTGTDPSDAASIPPYYIKLRLKDFIETPFRLKFTTPDDGQTFSINTVDLRGRTQFLKIGDTIQGSPYKLVSYTPKSMVDSNGIEKDVSILVLENTENGEKVELINNTVVNSPASFAVFTYLFDGSELKVKKGESFSLPPDDSKYKLIDISKEDALIEDIKSGAQIRIFPDKFEKVTAKETTQ